MAWSKNVSTFLEIGELYLNETKKDLSLSEFYDVVNQFINQANDFCESLHTLDWKSFEDAERDSIQCYMYRWSIDVLDVAIVQRDAVLRYSKKCILENSGNEEKKGINELPGVIDICRQAVQQNLQLIEEIKNGTSNPNPQWFHQIAPTSEVSHQLLELISQNKAILEAHKSLTKIVPAFSSYRDYLIDFSNRRLVKLRSLKNEMREVLDMIKGISEDSVLTRDEILMASKVLNSKNEIIENEKLVNEKFETFKSGQQLEKTPIYADGGSLIYKEFSFDKKVENWIENELFPKLYDADLDISSLYDSSIITLFNTRNKLENIVMNESESTDFDTAKICKSIQSQMEQIDSYTEHLDAEINAINKKVSEEMQISKVYDKEGTFLPELNFTNITKIRSQQWYKRNVWQSWIEEVSTAIKKRSIPFIKGIQQDSFSFVEDRSIEAHNIDTNSLFLKKGYLGRSFYIRREEKEQKIIYGIKRWRNGYQGSILIVGRMGSGKSSLLDYIPQYIENFPLVQLGVKNMIELNGRKHQATYDISESINFLAEQSISRPVIACIDDLELWQNEEFTMYDTIRSLADGISKFGKRIFFLITTNHFMHEHINHLFDFNSRFAEVVNVDRMPIRLMVDALVVRHNASLKNMELDEEASLAKKASRIASKSRNNLGTAMMAWERYIEKSAKLQSAPISFKKKVINHQLMLRVILTHHQIKESSLRKMLTSSDNYYVSEELRKLKGYKIVQRTFDGYLKVNPFIIDEVEHILLKENN